MADDTAVANGLPQPTTRDFLAQYLLIGCTLTLAAAAIAAILASGGKPETVQGVFTAVITLVGSWGGAVIAYYFGRENFNAASQQTQLAIKTLSGTPWQARKLREVMRSMDKAARLQLEGDAEALPLQALAERFAEIEPLERLPLVDAEGVVHYVIHLSTLNKYRVDHPELTAEDTVAALLQDRGLNRLLINGLRVLGPDDTLERAKQLIDTIDECMDIIVTETGKPDGRALGWLTNNALLEVSRA